MSAVVELSPEQYEREAELFCLFCADHGEPQEWDAFCRKLWCLRLESCRSGAQQ